MSTTQYQILFCQTTDESIWLFETQHLIQKGRIPRESQATPYLPEHYQEMGGNFSEIYYQKPHFYFTFKGK